MDVKVQELTDRAKRALVGLKREFQGRVRQADIARMLPGTILPKNYWKDLSDEYERRVKEIVREGMTDSRNDRTVRVQCPSCHRIEQIAGDVARWTCVCSSVERFAFQTYVEEP